MSRRARGPDGPAASDAFRGSPVDPAALDRLVEWGGPSLRTRIIGLFLELAPVRFQEIRDGLEQSTRPEGAGGLALARRSAHSLVSSAANVGAESVRAIAVRVEEALGADDSGQATELLPDLEATLAEALVTLDSIRGEGGA